MPGAIFQIRVRGKQDKMLTGNPDINFIKQEYKSYVNYAEEYINLKPNEHADFGKQVSFDIKNIGDLVHKMFLCVELPNLTHETGTFLGWTNSLGHALIEYTELLIGNQVIDKQYGVFMEIWNELTSDPGIRSSKDSLIGKIANVTLLETNAEFPVSLRIPMNFYFCKNLASALPLISLQFHSVKVKVKLRKFSECIVYDGTSDPSKKYNILDMYLMTNYIYIEESQRKILKDTPHKFLITQTQTVEATSLQKGGTSIELPFNHAVKELIFVGRELQSDENNDWFNFSVRSSLINRPIKCIISNGRVIFDNHDRNETMDFITMSLLNTGIYHSNASDKFINVMSFCSKPEDPQPSGSINFSAFTSSVLYIETSKETVNARIIIFAINYNALHIKDGMSSLEFSV
jgi:hypothetical protein